MTDAIERAGEIALGAVVVAGTAYLFGAPFVATFGQTFALGLVAEALKPSPPPDSGFSADSQGRQVMFRSGAAPRRAILGRAKVSGPLVFAATRDAAKENEVLSLVIPVAGHRVHSLAEPDYNLRTEGSFVEFEKKARLQIAWGRFVTPTQVTVTVGTRSSNYAFTTEAQLVAAIAADPTPPVVLVEASGQTANGAGGIEVEAWTAGEKIVWAHDATDVTPGVTFILKEYTVEPSGAVTSRLFLGADDQAADASLIGVGGWSADHRLRGISYMSVDLYHNPTAWPSGVPTPRTVAEGWLLYDPRKDSTNGGSGAHRFADPDTWEYSNNWALAVAWFLADAEFGLGCTIDEIDWATVIAAANISDEWADVRSYGTVTESSGTLRRVGLPHGFVAGDYFRLSGTLNPALDGNVFQVATVVDSERWTADLGGEGWAGSASVTHVERRYTINGTFTTDQEPMAILEGLRSAGGVAIWIMGQWRVHAHAARASTFDLTLDDLRGDLQYQARPARNDLFNAVRGIIVDRADYDQRTEFTPVTNATYESQDGGERIYRDVEYPFVDSDYRAQRLAKIELERGRQAIVVQAPLKLFAGLSLRPNDVGTLTVPELGWDGKKFEVVQWDLRHDEREGFGVDVVLKEYADAVYDWADGDATVVDPAPDTNLPDPRLVTAPADLSATSGDSYVRRNNDGTIQVMVRLAWTSVDAYALEFDVRWRRPGASILWTTRKGVRGGETEIGPLVAGEAYEFAIRARNILGAESDWSASLAHTPSGKAAPPEDVANFTATFSSDGRSLVLAWDPVGDEDIDFYEIRTGGANWDAASVLVTTPAPGELVISDVALLPAASATLRIKARDTSGNYSVTDNVYAATVNEPAAPGGLSAIVNGAKQAVRIAWTAPAIQTYAIDHYEIRKGGAGWADATVVGVTSDLSLLDTDLPTASVTYRAKAFDILGGETLTAATVAFTVAAPGVPTGLAAALNGAKQAVALSWAAPAVTTYPVSHYEIRKGGTGWADATVVGKSSTLSLLDTDLPTASVTYRIKAFDLVGGQTVTAATQVFTVAAPGTPTGLAATLNGAKQAVQLSWAAPAVTTYPVSHYEIRKGGTGWADATVVGKSSTLSLLDTALPTATVTYRIKAFDLVGGETVTAATVVFTVSAPNAPASLVAESSSRTAVVTLSWSQTDTTYPVVSWEIRRGPQGGVVGSATPLGRVDATRWAREEADGAWTYYVRATDLVGQVSAWASDDVIASYLARHVWQENEWFRPHDLATGNEWGTACVISRGGQIAVASSGFNGASTPDYVLAMEAISGGLLDLELVTPQSPLSPLRFGAYYDSMAMSASGDRLVVGDSSNDQGYVYIYRRVAGAYVRETRITAADTLTVDLAGRTVTCDAACERVAYANPIKETAPGSGVPLSGVINLATRAGTTWTLSGGIISVPAWEIGVDFDLGLDLSGNGLVLLVEFNNSGNRQTRVHVDGGAGFGTSPVFTITRTSVAAASRQSSISNDGEWLASPSGTSGVLEIWQADAVPAITTYTKVFTTSTGRACRSVRINRQGNLVLAVEMSSTDAYVVLYQRGESGWFMLKEVLMSATFVDLATSKLGFASCLSDDGAVVLVGDPDADKLWSFSAQPMQG